jgi:hypothetical protein
MRKRRLFIRLFHLGLTLWLIALLAISAAGLAVLAYNARYAARQGGLIFEGLTIRGVPVGGLTPEPGQRLRLCTSEGEYFELLPALTRQQLYGRELEAFLGVLRGAWDPVRPIEHELLVQETLLRGTGALPGV